MYIDESLFCDYPVRYTCIITTINHTLCIDDSVSLVIPMTSLMFITITM